MSKMPKEVRAAMAWLGSQTSPAKAAASRANAKRPRPNRRKRPQPIPQNNT
jgi:hypothetical protein